ncbi:hypothetical protein JTB14_038300 [Gonioctena quinquepunctata]|nr:hypothetical protein JTB14_038300 [Gonioctena quinquepunctata]
MISVIDNQLNYTKDFETGYVEDMMIEEEEILPPTNDDDEGIESDIPNNDVLVRRKTLSNSDMDGRACYIVSLVEGTYDHVEIHKIHTPTTPSFKCFGYNVALGQLRSIEACLICNYNLLK